MKTCLAVLAHQGARDTLTDFLPRWKACGVDEPRGYRVIAILQQDEILEKVR